MRRALFFVTIFCLANLVSCGSKSEPASEQKAEVAAPTTVEAPKKETIKGDVLASLQGKWQSLDDSKNVIEIKGNNFMTIYDGKNQPKETLDISATANTDCAKAVGVDLTGQTVFMTTGEFDASCFTLLHVDDKTLEYSMVGGTGNTLKFKKM